jgi:hypothetical protein
MGIMAMRLTLGLIVLFCFSFSAPALAQDWEKKARALLRSGTEDQVLEGADLCAKNDSAKAVEILCKAIAKIPRDLPGLRSKYDQAVKVGNAPHGIGNSPPPRRKGGGVGLPPPDDEGASKKLALLINARMSIERYVASALGRIKSNEAVDWMIKKGLKHKSWRVRSEVALALGKTGKNRVRDPLIKALKDKIGVVRSMAIDGLVLLKLKASVTEIQEFLRDKAWQVKVASINALVKFDAIKSVGALVAQMPHETGRIFSDIDLALQKLTGQNFKANADLWQSWYEANKEALDNGIYKRPKRGGGLTVERPSKNKFFSLNVTSNRILFVIDYSKSMQRNFERPKKETEKGQERVATGVKKGAKKEPKKIVVEGNTRIAEAKEQALRTMYAFPRETQFNVVIYHYGVELLAPKMLSATNRGLKYIENKVLNAELGLATNVFDALDRSFDITGTYKFEKNYKSPIDTIYFLSDGAPTSGRFANPGKILAAVKHWNRSRKIRIHTVLIRALAEPGRGRGERRAIRFMRSLAEANGGKFIDCKKALSP